MDWTRIGFALLAPAPLVFAVRSLLHAFHLDPAAVPGLGPLTGLTGALSMVGLAVFLWLDRRDAVPGALLVLVGHFVVSDAIPDLGAALVYLGTGVLVASRQGKAALAGTIAAFGALTRPGAEMAGHLLVAAGAVWLGVLLAWCARGIKD